MWEQDTYSPEGSQVHCCSSQTEQLAPLLPAKLAFHTRINSISSVQCTPSYFSSQIHFNIILPSMPTVLKQSLSLSFPDQNLLLFTATTNQSWSETLQLGRNYNSETLELYYKPLLWFPPEAILWLAPVGWESFH